MKKFLALAAFAVAFSATSAFAHDSTGCGLGSIIFKGQSGFLFQTLAVTTNGFFGNQTFGITTGTSGCDHNGRITGGTGKVLTFLEKNLEQFAVDAARGHGETIDTVAALMGVSSDKAGTTIKENFAFIFDSHDVSAVTVTLKVSELLA
ncbi:MAG: DUF3015 family protein [Alphaproteobacteria bacterium]|nr:DUF3015 family protein [Alphaproteobacteria bacterium]MBO4644278.1 DUF3015 family protein [Alphaproteobacteria bacterium]